MPGRFCALIVVCILVGGCGRGHGKPGAADAIRVASSIRQFSPASLHNRFAANTETETPSNGGIGSEWDSEARNTETYEDVTDNAFLAANVHPLSTFSIDVDTASYANLRRFLAGGRLPPRGAVRIEELLNYFTYDYPSPQKDVPFSVNIEISACPWNTAHRLARIGLKGREIARDQRPVSNLVFLIDVSGSMQNRTKLPLVKAGLKMLVDQLGENDSVAIVAYAGASGLVLPTTTGDRKTVIHAAIDNLQAGGSTNGGAGIELAYRTAVENFIPHGTNRVILCTDGDFNVGVTSPDRLVTIVEHNAQSGVFVTVLGFGMGNFKDSMLEKLADRGNGNYGYIDSLNEAKKLFIDQLQGTLITIAKDVKVQIEFNPTRVGAYRLIGYENRLLATEDFNDDKKDAGEIGAGHTVTALYEIIPATAAVQPTSRQTPVVEQFRDQAPRDAFAAGDADELFTLKLRYKHPTSESSSLIEYPAIDRGTSIDQASHDFNWAAAVAAFGMILRDSPHKGTATFSKVLEFAKTNQGKDEAGYRREFLEIVRQAQAIAIER